MEYLDFQQPEKYLETSFFKVSQMEATFSALKRSRKRVQRRSLWRTWKVSLYISWEAKWYCQISGLRELRKYRKNTYFLNSFRQTHPWANKKHIELILGCFFSSKHGFLAFHSTNYIMGQGAIHIATVHHYWVQQIVPGHVVGVNPPGGKGMSRGKFSKEFRCFFSWSTLNTHPKRH